MSQRAILYLRQSDSDGVGERSLSLDSQATVLRADAMRNNWAVIEEIRDADEKGWDDRRPGLLRLYERCRAGDVDVVAVWSLSRLARSLKIQEQVFDELSPLGVDVWSHEEPDVNRPLFRQILGAFNEEQTRVISAHVRRALQERHLRGYTNGPIPYGYRTEGDLLVVDEERAAVVQRIFELRANGRSWGDISEALRAEGIATARGASFWRKSTLSNIVRNRTYRGTRHFVSSTHVADCPVIVSPALWERAQRDDAYRKRDVRRSARPKSWLEGLVVHGCGQPMYGQSRLSRPLRLGCACGNESHQARCTMRPLSILASVMEQATWDIIANDLQQARSIPLKAIVTDAKRRYHDARPDSADMVMAAMQQRDRATGRRSRAEDLYLSGLRDRAWFEAEEARCAADIAAADATLKHLPTPPDISSIEQAWSNLRSLAQQITRIETPEARGIVLRQLGVACLSPDGISLKYHPHIAEILRERSVVSP